MDRADGFTVLRTSRARFRLALHVRIGAVVAIEASPDPWYTVLYVRWLTEPPKRCIAKKARGGLGTHDAPMMSG